MTEIKNTPLYHEHVRLKALMAPFAGWNMPIHYGSILDEAKHTRSAASIFDTSHMGEFIVRERPDRSSLDHVVTTPVLKMKNNRCRYGLLLNYDGKILDDFIVYRITEDEWMLVVNAANEERDYLAIRQGLSSGDLIENISAQTVKIDIQGPASLEVMKSIVGEEIKKLAYYGFDYYKFLGGQYLVSRTGYTGELGFEIYIDSRKGVELWHELMKHPSVRPAGLGARDILRLEMGYPLYGHEFTEETTPLDGGMERFLDMDKDFIGKEALVKQQERGVRRRLIGFVIDGRRTPRRENRIISGTSDAGFVTSGVFSPHLNIGIGMGYIDEGLSGAGKEIHIDTGKGQIRAIIEQVPFLKQTSIKYSEV